MTDLTRQLNIIHISDLHFGRSHVFKIPNSPSGDTPHDEGYPSLMEKLSEDLKLNDDDGKTIICLTGDFVDTSSVQEFQQAENFITNLLKVDVLKNLNIKDVFIVPGNHDVKYDEKDLGLRFQQYIEFYNRIYGTSIRRENPQKIPILHHNESEGIIIACLNSSTYVKKGTEDEQRGRIGIEDLELLISELESIPELILNNSIRIAIIHHHPVLIPSLVEPDRGYDAVHNSEKLITILKKHGFHAILHGHKHNPHTFTEDIIPSYKKINRTPMMIVAGGSIGSNELPSNPFCKNTYNIVKIKWHPNGNQTRVRVETRALTIYDDDRNLQIPTRWKWEIQHVDDRHFYGSNNSPYIDENNESRQFNENDEEDERIRNEVYIKTRGNLPVIQVLPSLINDQAYEVTVWIVRHRYGEKKPESDIPISVQYSAGPRFEVVTVNRKNDERFAAKFTYWGPMLIQCKLTFGDGQSFITSIYANMPNQYQ